jgi:hypothetical protein
MGCIDARMRAGARRDSLSIKDPWADCRPERRCGRMAGALYNRLDRPEVPTSERKKNVSSESRNFVDG